MPQAQHPTAHDDRRRDSRNQGATTLQPRADQRRRRCGQGRRQAAPDEHKGRFRREDLADGADRQNQDDQPQPAAPPGLVLPVRPEGQDDRDSGCADQNRVQPAQRRRQHGRADQDRRQRSTPDPCAPGQQRQRRGQDD